MRSISAPWRESASKARSKVCATASSRYRARPWSAPPAACLIGRGCNERCFVGKHGVERSAAGDGLRQRFQNCRARTIAYPAIERHAALRRLEADDAVERRWNPAERRIGAERAMPMPSTTDTAAPDDDPPGT